MANSELDPVNGLPFEMGVRRRQVGAAEQDLKGQPPRGLGRLGLLSGFLICQKFDVDELDSVDRQSFYHLALVPAVDLGVADPPKDFGEIPDPEVVEDPGVQRLFTCGAGAVARDRRVLNVGELGAAVAAAAAAFVAACGVAHLGLLYARLTAPSCGVGGGRSRPVGGSLLAPAGNKEREKGKNQRSLKHFPAVSRKLGETRINTYNAERRLWHRLLFAAYL